MNPVRLDPQGPFMRDPLAPHQMRDRLTRTQDLFILCHLGVPRIERDRWSLTIDGMVERPSTLRFDDLVRYPKTEVATIHQCCGSPLKPFEPRRRVCNIRWSGVRLVDVLADCRPRSAAQYIWSYGADSGEFSGVVVDPYLKDLLIARVEDDVLIAYEMNGSAMPAEHGFPARPRCSRFLWNQQRQMAYANELRRKPRARTIHDSLVQRPGAGWDRPGNRQSHAGLVDRARVAHRLAGAPRVDRAVSRAGNMGLGLGGWRGS
jgi:DMSO/TMAO reductase YedYZ molybdopterin-dependent catalytic subunit